MYQFTAIIILLAAPVMALITFDLLAEINNRRYR